MARYGSVPIADNVSFIYLELEKTDVLLNPGGFSDLFPSFIKLSTGLF